MDNVVLVVDDSPESLGMLNVALNSQGYTALVALNGAQALSIAEKIEPDIVLMDAVMPEMDGIEALEKIKEYNPDAKVIMITAVDQRESMIHAMKLGVSDFVVKPFNNERIVSAVEKTLGKQIQKGADA